MASTDGGWLVMESNPSKAETRAQHSCVFVEHHIERAGETLTLYMVYDW